MYRHGYFNKLLSYFVKKKEYMTKDNQYNAKKAEENQTVDQILDKISKKGVKSLTKKEQDILDEVSQNK